MSETNERSVASTGSVQPEQVESRKMSLDEFATAIDAETRTLPVQNMTPLTLTDAEREAISRVYDLLCDRSRELQSATRLDEARPLMQWAKTLRGLWERLGGGE